MSKWMVYAKKADFDSIGRKYGVDPVIARIMRNRDVVGDEAIKMYLSDSIDAMHSPSAMKDIDKAVDIIISKIKSKVNIRIIGDYDIDGVTSITILYKALKNSGAIVDYTVPHRINDGYGINESLIDKAYDDGIDTIITCDNGIAAIEQIAYAKSKGMTVIVTDHHDIPFEMRNGEKVYLSLDADATVNPKQPDCSYPFKKLCGAAVAYKLVEIIYKRLGLPNSDLEEYRQLAAVATIGDVVDLTDENRLLVKYGLSTMKTTKNVGLRTLIEECKLEIDKISAYHIGFVIGPCLNASGRLDTAMKAVELLTEENVDLAVEKARALKELNDDRKAMTEKQASLAIDLVKNSELADDRVLVVYLQECHESVAGIIAGRIREYFYKPTLVITEAENGAKGSGRSIEGYNMFEELTACRELLDKFGGHPMAAGFSLKKENIEPLRKMLNDRCTLTPEQLIPITWIDVPMPVNYASMTLVGQLKLLEPFGKGNEKPMFADRKLTVRSAALIGKNQNVLKMKLGSASGNVNDAVMFGVSPENIPKADSEINILYYPDINEYMGRKKLQFIVQEWKYSTG